MTDVMNVETVDRLQRVYSHIDDIDLFTGGLAERPVTGGVVGPTFACIIGQQFLNLRKGDRFWYENGNHPGAFTASQLQEIRKVSLSRVICDGLDDIESLQPFAFLTVDGFHNQRKACKGAGIPRLNLKVWAENSAESRPQELSSWSSFISDGMQHFSSASDQFNDVDFDFEQYLRQKIEVETEALAANSEADLAEVPTQLSRENYFHVFDEEPDPLINELFASRENRASSQAQLELEELHQKFAQLLKIPSEQ